MQEMESVWLTIVRDFTAVRSGGFAAAWNLLGALCTLGTRWILPPLAALILLRCALPLWAGRKKAEPCGSLLLPDGERLPLLRWENSIGRSRLCDVVIGFPFISRTHAVLAFSRGGWRVSDIQSRGGVAVNGEKVEGSAPIEPGDELSLAGLKMTLRGPESAAFSERDTPPARVIRPETTLLLILLFQALCGLELCFSLPNGFASAVPSVWGLFLTLEILHGLLLRRSGRLYFELEMLAYFLCGLGLCVGASAKPSALPRQLAAIVLGVLAFTALSLLIGNPGRARQLRYIFAGAALVLMALNLIFGQMRNGARNWIDLGGVTVQPMEFVKVAFVLAGAATLDRLLTARNLTAFLLFSGACIGTLAVTRDFGTALVFFCAYLVIAFLRSGDVRTLALIAGGAVLGGGAVISFIPYVHARFAAWGHVWQYADSSGYQQTRTMIAIASGGLLGLGGGNGYLAKIGAASTDLVFGVVCEEWGLLIGLLAVLVLVLFAAFALSSVGSCRSSLYSIAACGACTIFLTQTALNVFGSVDILPLTGVTFPFVSCGGSSIVTCWCLLAFVKSTDARFRPAQAAWRRTWRRRAEEPEIRGSGEETL